MVQYGAWMVHNKREVRSVRDVAQHILKKSRAHSAVYPAQFLQITVTLQTDKNAIGSIFSHHMYNGGDCWLLPNHFVGCQRSPQGMCKGFGDSRRLAREGDEACKAMGSFCNSCNATIQLGAECTPLANLKSLLVEWEKHWSHPLPFSLNDNTTRATLTTSCSQLMILLRMFPENLVLCYLGEANCENIWIYSYIKAWLSPVQLPGAGFQAAGCCGEVQTGPEGSGCSAPALAPCWSCRHLPSAAAGAPILQCLHL